MSKPVKPAIIVVAAGGIALSVLLVVFASRDKRSVPAPIEAEEPIAAATVPAPGEPSARPLPPAPAALAAVPQVRVATKSDAEKSLDETSLMTKLRDLAASDPSLSLRLAKEGLERFPDSPSAPEFNWNLVKALFNMGRVEEARAEARVMVAKYPGNDLAADVDHHLLNHPPNPADVPNP
jgi:hypothetical protein